MLDDDLPPPEELLELEGVLTVEEDEREAPEEKLELPDERELPEE